MSKNIRTYKIDEVVTFSSTKGAFGGLSNMAAGFSINVNGVIIRSTEALYQACRFPLFPEIQAEIIEQSSPMTAKMIARKHIEKTRQDWEEVKFKIMEWCIMVKLVQNWTTFSNVLLETGNKSIVEYSQKDKVWAATKAEAGMLEGINALGRILMKVRNEFVQQGYCPDCIEPPDVSGMLLFNHPIDVVCSQHIEQNDFEMALA